MERNETELEQIVKERLSPRRAQHTLQCAACARLLAQRFGADASAAYLAGLLHDITKEFINRLVEIIKRLIPCYIKEGKYSLTVAIGCTGGHHRSVAVANEIYRIFSEEGRRVTIEHRDL